MTLTYKIALVGLVILFSFGLQYSLAAPSLTVSTDKQIYEYGDFLSINFEVSELTGDQVIIHIIDESGKNSSPIPITIGKLNSTIIAPIPFYKTNYSPGTYQIEAEYSGSKTSTSFKLIDSNKVAIPTEYKVLVKSWVLGESEDKNFTDIIRDLIHLDIIKISNYDFTTHSVHVPSWFKNDARWWSDNTISDNEFGLAVQYLIKTRIMSV